MAQIRTSDIAWRDTYRPARFFRLDARIVLLILPTIIHLRWYTILITLLSAVLLFYFERRREMLVPGALRMIRWWIAGDERPPLPKHRLRAQVDFGRIDQ